MYKLYFYAPLSSWSLRPWILLKMLDIPFAEQQVPYSQDKAELSRLLATFSPTAKVPVLQDGERYIWDSLAIVEYLAESYPQVWPSDAAARAWARSACAEMHSGFEQLRTLCSYDPLKHTALTEIPPALLHDLQRINRLWQEGLSRFGGEYLGGKQFTAVDAFFTPVVGRIESYGLQRYLDPQPYAYFQRINALPALQEWLTK
ncbi:glutathione S-transferase family protein [Necropsobacter massiliensis]|uniref:glutathione S-transferase family protein n=1 Tax=Necropsobacter massiliensis TaxID=1400001 RepID=UPI000595C710|nr:glutathione S-transferase N-terminal domain-containing protein [Necropsobacter massiliensis]